MTIGAVVALSCIAVVAVVSTVISTFGVRFARNTTDFMVASRTVGTTTNAGAISGEYLSIASFLGVVGLVLKDGPDALWYPVGFTAGYLALLLFVSAPLRRSGAYTVPDFAEFRLRNSLVQRACTGLALLIGWMYLVPQLQGAGLTVATVMPDLPTWSGTVAAGVVVVATVVLGGMRSITFVQAFQYWLKLTALAVPVFALVGVVGLGDRPYNQLNPPQLERDTTISVKTDVALRVTTPVSFIADGVLDGQPVSGQVIWQVGRHTVDSGARLRFAAHTPIPAPEGSPTRNSYWLSPTSPAAGGNSTGLIGIYSLIVATFLGTMGLPHVLVRFYTNPDGRATRRTAVLVLALLGGFYLLPTLLGALSRLYEPQLLVSGQTDAAVLLLPRAVLGGASTLGVVLGGLIAAGAWAAFLSTSSGLVVGIAGVLSASANPPVLRRVGLRDFRVAAALAGTVPVLFSLVTGRQDFLVEVSLAFAVAASTFCPLLILGIWWRGLTDWGALVGLLVGGVTATMAVLVSMFGVGYGRLLGTLLQRPALITVPLAFLTMIVISKLTRERVLPDASRLLLRLHAPERLGLGQGRRGDEDDEPVDVIPGLGEVPKPGTRQ